MNKKLKIYAYASTVAIALLVGYIFHIHNTYELFVNKKQKAIIDRFNEVAIGSEYGSSCLAVRKWDSTVKIFIKTDTVYNEQMNFLHAKLNEINSINPEFLKIEITKNIADANCTLTMCKYENVKELSPYLVNHLKPNYGGFTTFSYSNYVIYASDVYINTSKSLKIQKNAILEEVVQSLGLPQDIYTDKESLFYQKKNAEDIIYQSLKDKDKIIIKLLYNPNIKPGFNCYDTERALRKILNPHKFQFS